MSQNVKASILSITKMDSMSEGMKYLGMSLFWRRNKVKWFEQLLTKIKSRIKNRNSKSLSQAGGTCLINSVPNTMTNYAMSNFLLPKNILQTINRCISKFWWGKERDRFVRFISWHKICQPKSFGGLVNKNSNIMNLVLLTKVAWRILTQPESLLSKVYRAKYVRSNGWWSSTCIGNQSFV